MSITTDFSLWFLLLITVIAGGFSFWLYKKKNQNLKKWQKYLLASLRFLVVFLLLFLLLSPLIKIKTEKIEKPIIVIAQDNSESIVLNKKSEFYRTTYLENLKKLQEKLSNDYHVKFYNFGEKLQQNSKTIYKDKGTNFSLLFDKIKEKFINRNLGAVILATDGIYNDGINPTYVVKKFLFPVYTIGLGDTTKQKDLKIQHIRYNKITFVGNEFPLEIDIRANKLKNKTAQLSIWHKGKSVFAKSFKINSSNFSVKTPVVLKANKHGQIHYRVQLTHLDDEITYQNNFKDIIIDVIDIRQKILLLYSSPHPDISAVKRTIDKNKNFEVEVKNIKNFNSTIDKYNLVILSQIPNKTYTNNKIINLCKKKKIPILMMLGRNSALRNINKLSLGFTVRTIGEQNESAKAYYNKNFKKFDISENLLQIIKDFPPLSTPFADFNLSNSNNILLFQKIKNYKTKKPLIFFTETDNYKIGVITGEGLWRWRMNNYLFTSTHEEFDFLINTIANYLAIKERREKFIFRTNNIYKENENIILEAEIYKDDYKLSNETDVKLKIWNKNKKVFNFVLNKTDNAYFLNIGSLPIGDYTYKATSKIAEKLVSKSGILKVLPTNIEAEKLEANHNLLYKIAKNTNAAFFKETELNKIYKKIQENKNIKSIAHTEVNFKQFISFNWLFFLILFLISFEWLLRKIWGV